MKIAVIDTETNWIDEVMSIGVVIADSEDYRPLEFRYFIFDPEYRVGGMFSNVLFFEQEEKNEIGSRKEALETIEKWIKDAGVLKLYAYNATFDKQHIKEFSEFEWFDIMRIAAYKQYNRYIPETVECCKTGRLKKNYGVESLTRMISGNLSYYEVHNALQDALDELDIMRMLGLEIEMYEMGRV